MADETPNPEPSPQGDQQPRGTGPLTPEVVDALAGGAAADGGEQVSSPTKLIRIASMARSLLDEARRAPLDDAGRRLLHGIRERTVHELEEILSEDLRSELTGVALPFTSETPTESELLVAQAQLVGWLEGLFHGIQAMLFTQQISAQQQFEEMRRRRALDAGSGPQSMPGGERDPGAYL